MNTGNRNSDLNVANWQIELLTLLPTGDKAIGKSVDTLVEDLLRNPRRTCRDEDEKGALKRKIQKTLQRLKEDETVWGSQLVCRVEGKNGLEERVGDSKKKSFWKWKDSKHKLILPPPNAEACLALLMVEKRLKDELPPATLEYLQPHFEDAKRRIQQFGGAGSRYMKWQQKIINQSPTQLLKPTKISKDVHNAILESLFENYQLRLSYLKHDGDQFKTYEVCPLGLIMRGPITYLIACKANGTGPTTELDSGERMFALHRIRKADVLDDRKARVPSGVSLEGFIERGGADFVIGDLANGQVIKLEMDVNSNVATRLKDTPLADNQTLTPAGTDKFRLTASLPITMQLGWWVLAFGPRVEVVRPLAFREWIATEHKNAATRYKKF